MTAAAPVIDWPATPASDRRDYLRALAASPDPDSTGVRTCLRLATPDIDRDLREHAWTELVAAVQDLDSLACGDLDPRDVCPGWSHHTRADMAREKTEQDVTFALDELTGGAA